ncbi:MAG: serine/threonine protein kinase [Brasilonema octagenarum HA4186-MV1]|jgi:serine/threonine protein kinase|nr:serine/threonine protein kinase [Brasilonema octagenarum HA4186-MV1]
MWYERSPIEAANPISSIKPGTGIMVREYPSSNNNGKSSDPTNKIAQHEIQQRLDKQAQDQENIMNCWQQGYQLQTGRYIIQETLGEGGFGVVYRARDTQLDRDVVIKTLNKKLQQDERFERLQEDLHKEAKRLSNFNHRNIVQIYDILHEQGRLYIVMEYIRGETLARRLERQGILEQQEALDYIRQISEALEVVHKNELAHRDVKPGNIIIRDSTREAVLIDFGIAREFHLQRHTAYSSEGYAPPEQYIENAPKKSYTDVYALAATLYTLLTRKVPSSARDREYQLKEHNEDSLISPLQINSRISLAVNQAIIQGMELKSENRPQSIQEWLYLLSTSEEESEHGLAVSKNEIAPIHTTKTATINTSNAWNFRQVEHSPTLPENETSSLEFLGRAALMGVAIWLLAISIVKLIENSEIRFLFSLIFCMALIFLAQYRLPSHEQRGYIFISSVIPTLLVFLAVIFQILPGVGLNTLTQLPIICALLTILTGAFAFIIMTFFKYFHE